jgi:hypothetical protein
MKKLMAMGFIVIMAVSITGCGTPNITLTNEQNDIIAEYAAGELLKYSYENEWEYQKLKKALENDHVNAPTMAVSQPGTVNQTITATIGATNSNGGNVGATNTSDPFPALASYLNLNGTQIVYSDCSIGERYPTDEYVICVPANEGYKIFAVEFIIKNTTGKAIVANTSNLGVTMKLSVNGTLIPMTPSMLKNDICGLDNVNIDAGKSITVAAVFQVPESLFSGLSSPVLSMYNNNTSFGSITTK